MVTMIDFTYWYFLLYSFIYLMIAIGVPGYVGNIDTITLQNKANGVLFNLLSILMLFFGVTQEWITSTTPHVGNYVAIAMALHLINIFISLFTATGERERTIIWAYWKILVCFFFFFGTIIFIL